LEGLDKMDSEKKKEKDKSGAESKPNDGKD
jgi:hypothetical protein